MKINFLFLFFIRVYFFEKCFLKLNCGFIIILLFLLIYFYLLLICIGVKFFEKEYV